MGFHAEQLTQQRSVAIIGAGQTGVAAALGFLNADYPYGGLFFPAAAGSPASASVLFGLISDPTPLLDLRSGWRRTAFGRLTEHTRGERGGKNRADLIAPTMRPAAPW
jgi:hypothetical protein